ncbi:MAG: T9SS type A sorting domain-containing protein [Bacteroidales bacterium]|nr:T9SS type A sorting domain-containing protein [Bacteroidales bacterium]
MKKIIINAWFILILSIATDAASLYVPSQYATIQAAINAAPTNSIIYVEDGVYTEKLVIKNKSLSIFGSSYDKCIIQYNTQKDKPNTPDIEYVITITGTGSEKIAFLNLQVFGGTKDNLGAITGSARGAFSAYQVSLSIKNIRIEGVYNLVPDFPGMCINAQNSTLKIENVEINKFMNSYLMDLGINIACSTASINGLISNAGTIDHVINISGNLVNRCYVTILNSTIRASKQHYGECIRVYNFSSVKMDNNILYRSHGGIPWDPNSTNHAGIGINGSNNNITITNNTITHLPLGINLDIIQDNSVKVENNVIENSENYAVRIANGYDSPNTHIDFGGGSLNSIGRNYFVNDALQYHFWVTNDFHYNSSMVIPAKNNYWTYHLSPFDLKAYIYDDIDDPRLLKIDNGTGANAANFNTINFSPSFILPNNTVTTYEDFGNFTKNEFALNINDGNPGIYQPCTFFLSNDNPDLFDIQPTIDYNGVLTFTTKADMNGTAKISAVLKDNGANNLLNHNSSLVQSFTINLIPQPDAPTSNNISITIPPNQPYVFKTSDFPYYDADGDLQTAVYIKNADNWYMKDQGSPFTMGTITMQDFINGSLTFVPPTNTSGFVSTFLFQVVNDGGIDGEIKDHQSAFYTMTVNVLATKAASAKTTDVNNLTQADQLTAYPNPVTNLVTIKLNNCCNGTVKLYDMLGNEFLTTSVNDGKAVFNMSALRSGNYVASVFYCNSIKHLKIVKE